MPIDLNDLVRPEHTALVTQECQEAVLGEDAPLPELARAAREQGLLPTAARLLLVARAAGVTVVHCTMERRDDGRGSNRNARLFAVAERSPTRLVQGTPGAAVARELDVQPSDIVLPRMHGLSPMTGTELDAVLRNLGCRTVVGVGVSVNIAILNFAFDAVNRGYQFVLPRDAVAGVPRAYVDAVIDNTLSLIATVTTTDALTAAWSA